MASEPAPIHNVVVVGGGVAGLIAVRRTGLAGGDQAVDIGGGEASLGRV